MQIYRHLLIKFGTKFIGSILNIYNILLNFSHFAEDFAPIIQKRMGVYNHSMKMKYYTFQIILLETVYSKVI